MLELFEVEAYTERSVDQGAIMLKSQYHSSRGVAMASARAVETREPEVGFGEPRVYACELETSSRLVTLLSVLNGDAKPVRKKLVYGELDLEGGAGRRPLIKHVCGCDSVHFDRTGEHVEGCPVNGWFADTAEEILAEPDDTDTDGDTVPVADGDTSPSLPLS